MLRNGSGQRIATYVVCLSVCLHLTLHVATAPAQSPGGSSRQAPGIWHQGRFLGYTPPHEARQQAPAEHESDPGSQPRATEGTRATPASHATRGSQHAVFHDHVHEHGHSHGHPHAARPSSSHQTATEISPLLSRIGLSDHDWAHGGGCGDGGCFDDACVSGHCYEPRRGSLLWGRAEYLLWWTKGLDTPVLATTSPAGTPRPQAGVLGAMNTAVLFGDDDLNRSSQSGARFTLGSWLDADECQGIEVTYLYVGEGRDQFQGATADFPILARPFFNTQNNSQDAKLISFPGAFAGDLDILATTEFQTWEVLLRHAGERSPGSQLDYLFGYRYARLRDALSIVETTNALSPPLTGTRVDLLDQFHSRSRFHGFELGLSYQWRPTPLWEAELLAKVALGRTSSSVDVHGETTTRTAQGSSSTSPAGFLANSSNIGSFTDSRFGALSEFGFMLQRDLHYGLKARLGYTFIHWGSVTRADGQFDGAVNPGQIAAGNNSNGARATTSAGRSSYWAQGLNFGLSYDF